MGRVPGTRRASGGFSLIETMVAIAILAVVCMGLMSLMAASTSLTNMQRQRSVAANAIQAYVEAMRGKSIAQIYADTTTPADYIDNSSGASKLKHARGIVVKCDRENGVQATAVGLVVAGSFTGGSKGSANTTSDITFGSATAGSNIFDQFGSPATSASDTTALAFTSGGRDLNGNGNSTDNLKNNMTGVVILPAMVRLEWVDSGGTGKGTLQKMVSYVCFGN